MTDYSRSISKKKLSNYIYLKMGREISQKDIEAVLTLLAEEFRDFFPSGKQIIVRNFAKMVMKQNSPRKFYDIGLGQVRECKPYNRFFFKVHYNLRKFLKQNIDKLATMKENFNIPH